MIAWLKRQMARAAIVRAFMVYMAEVPAPRDPVKWTEDDRRALAAFLEENPAGRKLAAHLADRLGDYERAAVVLSTASTATALCKRAQGFRDARVEIVRLSAAGPSPAKNETPDIALPDELERLRA